ncbi:MAG: two pore domain potassium channel family protein [Nanoarchaeota archaeon]|nr:two pore domain potassium channel family protein [Nanoarchaeota archaeon]
MITRTTKKIVDLFDQSVMKGRLKFLLVSLIALILAYPYLTEGAFETTILNIVFSLILLTGLYVVSYDKSHFFVGLVLALPALGTNWLSFSISRSNVLSHISAIIFYVYTIVTLVNYLLKAKEITSDVLFGAISTYLLIGIAFASVFSLVEIVHPNSFNIPSSTSGSTFWDELFYFSFVTITTSGYGDIVPVSPQARSLSVLEAVIGQMFLAIFISRLVGMYIYQKTNKN